MAERPVFIPNSGVVEERTLDFQWFPGFAIAQKQRSIRSLHGSAAKRGLSSVLEVSTKSPESLGRRLSAFNLRVRVAQRSKPILLEAAFQGSKVFRTAGGPFTRLYENRSGREVKRYMRQFTDDQLVEFQWEDASWPLRPETAFYDWLYIRALRDLSATDDQIDRRLSEYSAFTDIEFNPRRSLNCQARSCALYVALLQHGGGNYLRKASADRDVFLEVHEKHSGQPRLL